MRGSDMAAQLARSTTQSSAYLVRTSKPCHVINHKKRGGPILGGRIYSALPTVHTSHPDHALRLSRHTRGSGLNSLDPQEGRAEVSCPDFKRAESAESAAIHSATARLLKVRLYTVYSSRYYSHSPTASFVPCPEHLYV